MNATLEADRGEIERFRAALFAYADEDTFISARAFPHEAGRPPIFVAGVKVNGDASKMVDTIADLATRAANTTEPAVFAPPIATFRDGSRARVADLACGLCLSVEIDEGHAWSGVRKLELLLGSATVVVASGGEWADPDTGVLYPKLHAHWRLSEPTKTDEEHEALRTARVAAKLLVGGDPTAVPLVHPLRWPGSWHRKAAPKLARIVGGNPDAEIHLQDALERLEEAVEAAGLKAAGSDGPKVSGEPEAPIEKLRPAVLAIPNPDLHWDDWVRLGLCIHRATAGSDAGLALWEEWSRQSNKFTEGACDERWTHFHAYPFSRAGAGTIFWTAKQHGWEPLSPLHDASMQKMVDALVASAARKRRARDAHADTPEHEAEAGAETGRDDDDPPDPDEELRDRIEEAASMHRALGRRWRGDWEGLADKRPETRVFTLLAALKAAGFSFEDAVAGVRLHDATAAHAERKGESGLARMWAVLLKNDSDYDAKIKARIEKVVHRFNQEYFVVNEAGNVLAYSPRYDRALHRRSYDRLEFGDLQKLYMNECIEVGINDKGKPVIKSVAEVWLAHPDRKQYRRGIEFNPSGEESNPETLNLWQGYAVKPKAGDWSLFRAHLKDIVCNGRDDHYNYLFGWLARLFQRPAEQGEIAVVLKGGEGTGKGTLAKVILRLMGQHGLAVSNAKHLVGNFNGHLRDAVFLFCDEAFFAGDKAHVGVLKSLITEPYLTVEAKFQNAVQQPNFLHVLMASNETWVVPASIDARRFFVLVVNEAKKNDHAYFADIWRQMESGGYEAMLHDLLDYDLTTYNVRAVPTTEGLQEQKKLSLDTTHAWWADCLERGYVFRSRLGLEEHFGIWHEKVTTELLHASYMEFAQARREHHPLGREALGRFLVSLKAEPKRWRSGVVGEHLKEETNAYGGKERRAALITQERATGYVLGDLDTTRASFVEATGLSIVWDPGDDADEANE